MVLVNLGSPDFPEKAAIRRFLKELLSDPRVMSMPAALRWGILNFLILPFRPGKIVKNYQSIWSEDGFPLIAHGKSLVNSLSEKLGDSYTVQLAMRYGSPSIDSGLQTIRKMGVKRLTVMPLFPQYATATTGSVLARVFELIDSWDTAPKVKVYTSFYDDSAFINCWVKNGLACKPGISDHILFSFHGLPVNQVQALAPCGSDCLKSQDCCNQITDLNKNCYRAQCVQTAMKIAEGLEISPGNYSISFQSRLGRTQWLEPYTSQVIQDLAIKGIKNLLVFCPSFVADCLETLYEIEIEENERFLHYGGESLSLVPSLNSDELWVEALHQLILKEK